MRNRDRGVEQFEHCSAQAVAVGAFDRVAAAGSDDLVFFEAQRRDRFEFVRLCRIDPVSADENQHAIGFDRRLGGSGRLTRRPIGRRPEAVFVRQARIAGEARFQ